MASKTEILTRQERIQEIVKCAKDPIYFIKTYMYIQHPMKGRVKFDLYPFQEDCIRDFNEYKYNIILKSRQLGLSTSTAAYCLWLAMFHRDKNIIIMATKLEVGKFMVGKIREAFQMIPKWLLEMLELSEPEAESVKYLRFSNGSKITAIPTSKDAGRGEAVSLLVVDEAAHIENLKELWLGIRPTLSTGGRAIVFSTPNGKGNYFHELWAGADTGEWEDGKSGFHGKKTGTNGFHPIKLPWTVHPERDEKWFENEAASMDQRGISQELLCVGEQTKILTVNGLTKAKDIRVGDMVLTHQGRFREVTGVAGRKLRPEENLYRVSTPGNRKEPIFITGNHPVYGYKFHLPKGRSSWEYLKENEKIIKPSFTPLDDIASFKAKTNKRVFGVLAPKLELSQAQEDKYIDLLDLYPAAKITKNTVAYWRQRSKPTKRHVKVDYDLGYWIGLAVAEGCIIQNKSKAGAVTESLQLAFKTSEERNTLGKWVENFYRKAEVRYAVRERKYSDCFTIKTTNKYFIELYKKYVTVGDATTKSLKLAEFLSSGSDFIKGYLSGHFAGDGDHDAKKANSGNKIKLVCKSENLLHQVRTLLTAFEFYPRIGHWNGEPSYLEIDGLGNRYSKISEFLDLGKENIEKSTSRTHLLSNHIVGQFQYEIVGHDSVEYVIDIEVEEDNSFVASGLVLHNCSFESSGYTYFQQADIDHIKFGAQSPIMFGSANGPGNDLWIWKTPQPKVKYLIVADIARGDSEDYSTFHIIDMVHSDIAAEYMGKIPTDEFGVYLAKMGMNYNQALIVIEKNTYGVATGNKLRELRYPNLYYDPEIAEKMKYMLEEDKRKEIPGFQVTVKNRELALGNLEACIRNKQIRIYSTRFASQMESFIFNGKRGQALKGKNDDLIMAMAIGLQIFTPNAGSVPEQNLQEVSWQVAFLKGISRSNVDMNVIPGAYGTNAATYNPYSAAAGRVRMANALKPASTFSDSEPEVLRPLEQYQGKTLPPGVKKDDVALQQAIFNEYSWLLK